MNQVQEKIEVVAGMLNMTAQQVSCNSGVEIYRLTSVEDPLLQINVNCSLNAEKASVSPIWPRDHHGNLPYLFNAEADAVKAANVPVGISTKKTAQKIADDIESRLLLAQRPALEIYKGECLRLKQYEDDVRGRAARVIQFAGFPEAEALRRASSECARYLPVEFTRWSDHARTNGRLMRVNVSGPNTSNIFIDDLSEEQLKSVIQLVQSFKK